LGSTEPEVLPTDSAISTVFGTAKLLTFRVFTERFVYPNDVIHAANPRMCGQLLEQIGL